jgi:ubiquinone/menaquinone biosynthesis C-methylase UbiE
MLLSSTSRVEPMGFPHHDENWTQAADFVRGHAKAGDAILAPDAFWWLFDRIFRYLNTFRDPSRDYDFAIIHKGEIANIEPRVLRRTMARGHCVFANAVFVVWSARADLRAVWPDCDHLEAFRERLDAITPAERAAGRALITSDATVLPDPGVITKFETLDAPALKAAMNRFWENGGYRYDTLRDQAYYAEIDRHIAHFAAGWTGKRILDLACGSGRLPAAMGAANSVAAVDLSEVAVRRASESSSHAACAVMDAHRLGFPAASFSVVLFIDAIEHVKDAPAVLAEIARVLAPGGEVIATVANRNSLHEIIARKLGMPEFKTNYQHIREFTFAETRALLEERGLSVVDAKGILLFPFWGIPLLDEAVRGLTDDDAELVEVLRVLGERAGPEFAYAFTVRAVKQR